MFELRGEEVPQLIGRSGFDQNGQVGPAGDVRVRAGECQALDRLAAGETSQVGERDAELALVPPLDLTVFRAGFDQAEYGEGIAVHLGQECRRGLQAGNEQGVLVGGNARRQGIERRGPSLERGPTSPSRPQ